MEIIRDADHARHRHRSAHGGSGDPSPFTALGVRRGIEACVKFKLGKGDARGRARRGAGRGPRGLSPLSRAPRRGRDAQRGRRRSAQERAAEREFGAAVVAIETVTSHVACDVLAPCALGGAINDRTLPELRCKIVAGAANNQLASDETGVALHARGLLYAPDYAINAGGLINVAQEVAGLRRARRARERTLRIYDTITEICERGKRLNAPTYKVADILVEEKLGAATRSA